MEINVTPITISKPLSYKIAIKVTSGRIPYSGICTNSETKEEFWFIYSLKNRKYEIYRVEESLLEKVKYEKKMFCNETKDSYYYYDPELFQKFFNTKTYKYTHNYDAIIKGELVDIINQFD